MPSLRSLVSGGLLILAGALVFQACSSQGEAMRCEDDGDCESGLTCVGERVCCSDRICCPAAGAETTKECRERGNPPTDGGIDTGTPVDTGTVDTGTPDTGMVDTGTADTGTLDTGTADTGAD